MSSGVFLFGAIVLIPAHWAYSSTGYNMTDFGQIEHLASDGNPSAKQFGVILPALVCALALGMVAVWCSYRCLDSLWSYWKGNEDSRTDEPEKLDMWHLCNETTAIYKYQVIFRVGSPTPNFNMREGYIQFELGMVPGDRPFALPCRFSCALLPNRLCRQMHLFISSPIPLGEISGIWAQHNDPQGNILFYDYVCIDRATDSIQAMARIDSYITTERQIFRAKDKNLYGICQFPEFPLTWTVSELVIMVCLVMMTNAFGILIIIILGRWDADYKSQQGIGHTGRWLPLLRSLVKLWTSFQVALFSLALPPMVILTYMQYYKKKALQSQFALFGNGSRFWHRASLAYLVCLVVISLVMATGVIWLGLHMTVVKSLYWFLVWAPVTVLVLACWFTLNRGFPFKRVEVTASSSENSTRMITATTPTALPTRADIKPSECPVCYEPLQASSAYAPECGHPFCGDCIAKFQNSGQSCAVCRGPIEVDISKCHCNGLHSVLIQSDLTFYLNRMCQ